MAIAAIDDQELYSLLSVPHIKNLDNFRVKANLSKLAKKFNELKSTDALTAYTYLGMIEMYKNNHDEAIQLLKKALKISPTEFVVLYNIGICYELSGNYNDAIVYFKKIIDNNPTIYKKLLDMALFYFDDELLKFLENSNKSKFSKFNVKKSSKDYYPPLNKFDFEQYRIQLNIVNKVVHKYLLIPTIRKSKFYNFDGGNLVTNIDLETDNIEIINQIIIEYEEELFKCAQKQEDGGFEFYEKLNQSVVSFDVAS
ncbi:tetratricopeptide repeat protein [Acinetobacter pittii]|uniref:tetratricopeptide repeat protein n=1 Tax=Acinetobacter pittii TaxID=48296 RepID=UPI003A845533